MKWMSISTKAAMWTSPQGPPELQGHVQGHPHKHRIAHHLSIISILSVVSFSIASSVSFGFAMGILRLRTCRDVPVDKETPPWLDSNANGEQKKMIILQELVDMHLNNGVPPPDVLIKSADDLVRTQAKVKDGYPIEIVHCVSCSPTDGYTWSAAFQNGYFLAASIKESTNQSALVKFTQWNFSQWDVPQRWHTIDIGVVYGCQDSFRLRRFIQVISDAIGSILPRFSVRLIVPYHSCGVEDTGRPTKEELETLSGIQSRRTSKNARKMKGSDGVIILPIAKSSSEVETRHAIHANTDQRDMKCLLIVAHVNDYVNIKFITTAMAIVSPGVSAYFPIRRFAYNPESINAAWSFRELSQPVAFHRDRGGWMKASFHDYAIAAPDAAKISLECDSAYTRWASSLHEGHGCTARPILRHVHIVRKLERGLIYMWYSSNKSNTQLEDMTQIPRYSVRTIAQIEASTFGMFIRGNEHRFSTRKSTATLAQIMIAVTTSRTFFSLRVAALEATWAKTYDLPAAVVVRYFVGKQSDSFVNGSAISDFYMKRELALQAQLINPKTGLGQGFDPNESIVILHDVEDGDYLSKKRATLKAIAKLHASSSNINWIMVIDDDVYVHISGLQRLLARQDERCAVLLGPVRRDQENISSNSHTSCRILAGWPTVFYGPAYVMSYDMLAKMMRGVMREQECARNAETLRPSKLDGTRWDAIVTRMCFDKAAEIFCQENSPNYHASNHFQQYDNDSHAFVGRQHTINYVSLHTLGNMSDMESAFQVFGRRRRIDFLRE